MCISKILAKSLPDTLCECESVVALGSVRPVANTQIIVYLSEVYSDGPMFLSSFLINSKVHLQYDEIQPIHTFCRYLSDATLQNTYNAPRERTNRKRISQPIRLDFHDIADIHLQSMKIFLFETARMGSEIWVSKGHRTNELPMKVNTANGNQAPKCPTLARMFLNVLNCSRMFQTIALESSRLFQTDSSSQNTKNDLKYFKMF